MLATQNVNVTIARDTSIRSGTDRVKHLAMVAALNPVQPGSSISHWDTAGIPNQLMEPSINADLTASVRPPEDLTSSQMTDIGWFSDGDGVPDGKDNCIGSDLRPTVVIGTCNSKAGNDPQANVARSQTTSISARSTSPTSRCTTSRAWRTRPMTCASSE